MPPLLGFPRYVVEVSPAMVRGRRSAAFTNLLDTPVWTARLASPLLMSRMVLHGGSNPSSADPEWVSMGLFPCIWDKTLPRRLYVMRRQVGALFRAYSMPMVGVRYLNAGIEDPPKMLMVMEPKSALDYYILEPHAPRLWQWRRVPGPLHNSFKIIWGYGLPSLKTAQGRSTAVAVRERLEDFCETHISTMRSIIS